MTVLKIREMSTIPQGHRRGWCWGDVYWGHTVFSACFLPVRVWSLGMASGLSSHRCFQAKLVVTWVIQ